MFMHAEPDVLHAFADAKGGFKVIDSHAVPSLRRLSVCLQPLATMCDCSALAWTMTKQAAGVDAPRSLATCVSGQKGVSQDARKWKLGRHG